MSIFQLIGLILPVIFILWIYGKLIQECNNGNGDTIAPKWQIIIIGISLFVFGLTLGTLI